MEFAASDLLGIVETFAQHWDDLRTAHPERGGDCRAIVVSGHLLCAVSFCGRLSPVDGAVELIDIAIEPCADRNLPTTRR